MAADGRRPAPAGESGVGHGAAERDVERPEAAELSDEAIELAERQAQLDFRAQFAAEPVDTAWAPRAERFGRELLDRVPELKGATIECRTRSCEVRPDIAPEDASRLIVALTRDREIGREFGVLRNTGDESPDDDTYEPVWYLKRGGTARIEPVNDQP